MPRGNDLVVNMSLALSDTDPWFGQKKCLAMLYSLGTSIRTFVACENDPISTLTPGGMGSNSPEITRFPSPLPNFTIVSVVWGKQEIRTQKVYDSLYEFKGNGSDIPFSNDLFLEDSLISYNKSAVIWYTSDDYNIIKSLNGKEGDRLPFEE